MAAAIDARITVGDRQFPVRWTLKNPDGTAATLTAVKLRMVNIADNTVKINDAVCTFTLNVADYAFSAADVDTAGTYSLQMWDLNGAGKPQRWPAGREYLLEIVPVV